MSELVFNCFKCDAVFTARSEEWNAMAHDVGCWNSFTSEPRARLLGYHWHPDPYRQLVPDLLRELMWTA